MRSYKIGCSHYQTLMHSVWLCTLTPSISSWKMFLFFWGGGFRSWVLPWPCFRAWSFDAHRGNRVLFEVSLCYLLSVEASWTYEHIHKRHIDIFVELLTTFVCLKGGLWSYLYCTLLLLSQSFIASVLFVFCRHRILSYQAIKPYRVICSHLIWRIRDLMSLKAGIKHVSLTRFRFLFQINGPLTVNISIPVLVIISPNQQIVILPRSCTSYFVVSKW